MNHILLPNKDVLLTLNQKITEICKPLEVLDITFFNYLKVFKDGSRIDLNSHVGITDFYYYQSESYLGQAVEWDPFVLEEGVMLWSSFEDPAWSVMREEFDTTHGITILEKKENYCELFHFATKRENIHMLNFYMNNMGILKMFTSYFKEKAKHIIKTAEENKIVIPNYNDILHEYNKNKPVEAMSLEQKIRTFFSLLDVSRYYLPDQDGSYLTKQEINCLRWAITGKTMEETALILNISKRTCEAHFENIKNKLKINKQFILGFNIAKLIPEFIFKCL